MRIYLQALDYKTWKIVSDGSFMLITKDEELEEIPKPSRESSESEKKKTSLNSKFMNALFCAIDKKEFHKVLDCSNVYKIQKKLEVIYEHINQVKEYKINNILDNTNHSKQKKMRMFTSRKLDLRILNTLGALGKTFLNSKKVKKIIRTFPKR